MTSNFTTRPGIGGTFGAVASTHWIGTAVGMSMLERGGNAFDAAVATGFTLQIVEPHLNGPGGEVPIILHQAGADGPQVICGQGVAPKAATIEPFDALDLKLVPGTGMLPAVVPGAFDAWMLLLRDYGTLSLRDVLEPAIFYAGRGFPWLRAPRPQSCRSPNSSRRSGRPRPPFGCPMAGRRAFYKGFVAEAIGR